MTNSNNSSEAILVVTVPTNNNPHRLLSSLTITRRNPRVHRAKAPTLPPFRFSHRNAKTSTSISYWVKAIRYVRTLSTQLSSKVITSQRWMEVQLIPILDSHRNPLRRLKRSQYHKEIFSKNHLVKKYLFLSSLQFSSTVSTAQVILFYLLSINEFSFKSN